MKFEIYPSDKFVMPVHTPMYGAAMVFDRERRYETHLAFEVDLGVGCRRYLLRIWNNFLYFTVAPQEQTSPVWTCLSPLAETAGDAMGRLGQPEVLLGWWKEEVRAGQFGVLEDTFLHPINWECACVWACDGVGQLRPWWDDRMGEGFMWPVGAWNTREALLNFYQEATDANIWFHRWQELVGFVSEREWNENLSDAENEAWGQTSYIEGELESAIRAREILPRHRVECPLTWKWGDEDRARALITAIVHLDDETWQRSKRLKVCLYSRSPLSSGAFAFPRPHPILRKPGPRGALPRMLIDLLNQELEPIGWTWSHGEDNSGVNSSIWDCVQFEWIWHLSPPSHHEKLEAHLVLKEWLDELVAKGRVDLADEDILLNWPESLSREELTGLRRRLSLAP